MVRKKKKRKRVTKDCLTIRTPTSYPKEPTPSRIHQRPSRLRHSRFLSGPLTRCTRGNPTLCKNTRGWRGKKKKGGRKAGVAEERGQGDAVWKVKETHTSASRWLMQRGEIFISLPAWLGGAGQPTLYIS